MLFCDRCRSRLPTLALQSAADAVNTVPVTATAPEKQGTVKAEMAFFASGETGDGPPCAGHDGQLRKEMLRPPGSCAFFSCARMSAGVISLLCVTPGIRAPREGAAPAIAMSGPAGPFTSKEYNQMSDDYQDRPRRPMRETVCDIDRDILKLVMRRHNLIQRMASPKGRLAPQEERYLRESWESQVAKVSADPRLASRFFTLLQEVDFLPRPEDGGPAKRPFFGLAPSTRPVTLRLNGFKDQEQTRLWSLLAASSGSAVRMGQVLLSDAVADCSRMLNQFGADFHRAADSMAAAASAPCEAPDKIIHVGSSAFNFYMSLAHYIGRPSHAKFTGGADLKLADFSALRHFLPTVGARLIALVPRSDGLPMRLESAGLVPELVRLPADLPAEFVICLLAAAPFYGRTTRFELAAIAGEDRADILRRALPVLRQAGAGVDVDGTMVAVRGDGVAVPSEPVMDMDPTLAAALFGLAAVNGGVVELAGTWPETARAAAVEELFAGLGLEIARKDGAVSLRTPDGWTLPDAPIAVPARLPADLAPLPLALACVQALRHGRAVVPAGPGDVPGDLGGFAGACGLLVDGDAIEPRHDDGMEHGTPVWTAPSGMWACALAIAALARPHAGRGFQLNNPGVLTELWPGFWSLYNALPEPVQRRAEEAPVQAGRERRRILTSEKAQLTPRPEEDF